MKAVWITGIMVTALVPLAYGQTPAPLPSYTFTFSAAETDLVYAALDRASQVQMLVTGERSSRFDGLMAEIKQRVMEQNTAAKPKQEAPKQ